MSNFLDFIGMIIAEVETLLSVVPVYVSITIGVALTFITVLAIMRVIALIEDDIPFI